MAESLQAAVRHCAEEPVRALLQAAAVQAEVDKLGASGVNALGLAVWRNHLALTEVLLEAGADPNAPDSESGWSPLHRALYGGQLRIAAALLRADASLALPDWRGRTPLDLLSAELKEYLAPGGSGDVFSWGNGSNYTLGTGSTDLQEHPARLEGLHDLQVAAVAAAKFHSAAVTADGRLLTWGWGRGGRLGHPDAQIHSGEGAVITPLPVAGLGRRQVAAVAAGKHHTLLCTAAGEVFSMGSNRHGQLGYATDSQPTPRRVSALRARVVAVAAANKHSVAVTAAGDAFTWGSNALGQLGYGTSDSASSATPRLVEAMRGKRLVGGAAAKRHTLVLTDAGEVYSWGHRGVSPRRVQLAGARDAAAAHGAPISFHRGHADVARPAAAAVCAGAAHSCALTTAGVVLCWRSADPGLQVQEVGGALAGKRVVSIAAGKYRTAAVSDEGDVFMWEGRSDYFPAEGRQPGSGSKKPAAGSASRARPIPRPPAPDGGGDHLLGGSLGADGGGSARSLHRRPSSFAERFAREREAASGGGGGGVSSLFGTSPSASAPLGSSLGASSGGRGLELLAGSAGRPSRASDTFERILPERVEGLKRAVAVAVGEKHSLAVQRWSAAQLEGMVAVPWLAAAAAAHPSAAAADDDSWMAAAADDGDEAGALLGTPRDDHSSEAAAAAAGGAASPAGGHGPGRASPVRPGLARGAAAPGSVGVPSLQRICEEEVAGRLVDPRSCLQVLEYADVAGAELLRAYCLAVAACNLDAVLLEAGRAFEELPPHLLADLEALFRGRLAGPGAGSGGGSGAGGAAAAAAAAAASGQAERGPAGQQAELVVDDDVAAVERRHGRRQVSPRFGSLLQPGWRPTAAAAWLGDGEPEAAGGGGGGWPLPPPAAGPPSFRDRSQAAAEAAAQRLLRTLHKKLQQIEQLEARAAAGAPLDPQQAAKVAQRPVLLSAAAALEGGAAVADVHAILRAASASREPEAGASGGAVPASGSKAGRRKKGAAGAADGGADAAGEPFKGVAAGGGSLLGCSPPASALVPAFGAAGSAAASAVADGPQPPLAAAEQQPALPTLQPRSQVGFAASGATDGVAATAARPPGQPGEQQAGGAQAAGGSKPKSAAKRRGGLSMFLRGELDPPTAPAWGRAAEAPGPASLKEILSQEAAEQQQRQQQQQLQQQQQGKPPSGARGTPGSGSKLRPGAEAASAAAAATPMRLTLQSFMQSSPLPAARASPPPPAWGAALGASPPGRQPSFRAIQQEQQAAAPRHPPALGTSPPLVHRPAAGLPPWRLPSPPAAASLLGSSPSAGAGLLGSSPLGRPPAFHAAPVPAHSKWYVPEESRVDPRSLLSIQTEEEELATLAALAAQFGQDSPAQARQAAQEAGPAAAPQEGDAAPDRAPAQRAARQRAGRGRSAGGKPGGGKPGGEGRGPGQTPDARQQPAGRGGGDGGGDRPRSAKRRGPKPDAGEGGGSGQPGESRRREGQSGEGKHGRVQRGGATEGAGRRGDTPATPSPGAADTGGEGHATKRRPRPPRQPKQEPRQPQLQPQQAVPA